MKKSIDIETEKDKFLEEVATTMIGISNIGGGKIKLDINEYKRIMEAGDELDVIEDITENVVPLIQPDIKDFTRFVKILTNPTRPMLRIEIRAPNPPYYLKAIGQTPEGLFINSENKTIHATQKQILKMIEENSTGIFEETRSLCQNLTFSESKRYYSRKGLHLSIDSNEFQMNNQYTNLALLLSNQCPHSTKIVSLSKLGQVKKSLELKGSLIKQIRTIYESIKNFSLDLDTTDAHATFAYPSQAVFESFRNMIIHHDYSSNANSFIKVYPDRIEFISMGGLTEGISESDIFLGISASRNKLLLKVFSHAKLASGTGTGITKIMRSYENYAKKPLIEISDNVFKITLFRTHLETEKVRELELKPKERDILALFADKEKITRKDIEENLDMKQSTALKYLATLKNKQLILAQGKNKNTVYVLAR